MDFSLDRTDADNLTEQIDANRYGILTVEVAMPADSSDDDEEQVAQAIHQLWHDRTGRWDGLIVRVKGDG